MNKNFPFSINSDNCMISMPPSGQDNKYENNTTSILLKSLDTYCKDDIDFERLFRVNRKKLDDNEKIYQYHYISLQFVRQNGPQCGYAALAMIGTYAGIHKQVNELVEVGKKNKLTLFGEMFSANNMLTVAQLCFGGVFYVTLKNVATMQDNCHELLKEHLNNNRLILLAYDTDGNHEPCLKNGHRAHWAVICGYIEKSSNLYVIARHGKSRNLALWNFVELLKSSGNLVQVSPMYANTLYDSSYPLQEHLAHNWIIFESLVKCSTKIINE